MARTPSKTRTTTTRRGRRSTAVKSASKPKTAAQSAAKTSKQAAVIALLRRQQGASIAEIVELTGWLPASTRGFMSGAVKKRLGIDVISEKGEDGVSRYYVAPDLLAMEHQLD